MGETTTWVTNFLDSRELVSPDGRPLFQYLLSQDEFNELQDILSSIDTIDLRSNRHSLNTQNLFLIYASDWWRRNYRGGAWSWRLITDSLAWDDVPYPVPIYLVKSGLKYWKRELQHYGDSRNAYLLSVVLEGGFPINILETANNSLTRYLKAVLDDYATYYGSGIPTTRIAEGFSQYLPKGFRRDAVYRLASNVVEVIYDLSKLLTNNENPFQELQEKHSNWQKNFPFSLDSESAGTLVNALLKRATTSRATVGQQIRFKRYFINEDSKWNQHATLVIPATIPIHVIAESLQKNSASLPDRMDLTLEGSDEIRKVATLVKVDDLFNVYIIDRNRLDINVDCTYKLSCSLIDSGTYLGEMPIDGGDAVDLSLPIILGSKEDQEELEIIGTGGIKTRYPTALVIIPDGSEILNNEGDFSHLGEIEKFGQLYQLSGLVSIKLEDGLSVKIQTNAEKDSASNCRLYGKRQYSLESTQVKIGNYILEFSKALG
ncbi:MAG: STY4851/ECs_5259 family protein [Proteobacteria bacterium]|nr:STY4851/ECs_5259 family protein [Pseudomonadota bacterium]